MEEDELLPGVSPEERVIRAAIKPGDLDAESKEEQMRQAKLILKKMRDQVYEENEDADPNLDFDFSDGGPSTPGEVALYSANEKTRSKIEESRRNMVDGAKGSFSRR
jgi:hypothetical protein